MREILFRGKRIDNGEWVYGIYLDGFIVNGVIESTNEYIVLENWCPVDEETVGQYTGLKDKNGKKIFEGDILLSESWGSNARSKRKTHIVEWGRDKWLAAGYNGEMKVKPSLDTKSDWQVIGNIHDNKELIKE